MSLVSAREAVGRSVGQTIVFCGLPPCHQIAGNLAPGKRLNRRTSEHVRVGAVGQTTKNDGLPHGSADGRHATEGLN